MKKERSRFSIVNLFKREQTFTLFKKLTFDQLLNITYFNKKETLLFFINHSLTKHELQAILFQSTISDENLIKFTLEFNNNKNNKEITDKALKKYNKNRFEVVNSYKKEHTIEILNKLTSDQLLTVTKLNNTGSLLNLMNRTMTKNELQSILFKSTISDDQLMKYFQEINNFTEKQPDKTIQNTEKTTMQNNEKLPDKPIHKTEKLPEYDEKLIQTIQDKINTETKPDEKFYTQKMEEKLEKLAKIEEKPKQTLPSLRFTKPVEKLEQNQEKKTNQLAKPEEKTKQLAKPEEKTKQIAKPEGKKENVTDDNILKSKDIPVNVLLQNQRNVFTTSLLGYDHQ